MPALNENLNRELQDVAAVRAFARAANLRRLTPNRGRFPSTFCPVAICVIRNEQARLGELLRHHREQGIARFLFVDNGSTDGGPEFLARQPDVDLFATTESFDWQRKHGWINRLIDDHGRDRWYLLVDADEHVVYVGDDRASLTDIARIADTQGCARVRGCLVDMYAEGPVLATYREPATPMREAYPWFDPGGYAEHRNAVLVSRTGGPRRRMLGRLAPGFEPQLTKYPLFRLRPDDVAVNPHYIWPPEQHQEDRCYLGILHYKFDGDLLPRIEDAVSRRQYWKGSSEYFTYREALHQDPLLTFFWGASRRYRSADDLVRCGLIEPLLESAPPSFEDLVQTAARQARACRLAAATPLTPVPAGAA